MLGRPTWVYGSGDEPARWVDEVRPGVSVHISSSASDTPLAELHRIAAGIRWTG